MPPPVYYGQPPRGTGTGRTAIIAIFVGILVAIGLIAGIVIFLAGPIAPEPPCLPGEACAPRVSLPPISQSSSRPATPLSSGVQPATPAPNPTPGGSGNPASPGPQPTPGSDAGAAMSGTLVRSETLDYSFEYDSDFFSLTETSDGLAVLDTNFFDARVFVVVEAASTSPADLLERELGRIDERMLARTEDTDDYDALLGPSIGYIDGKGDVYSGTILGSDGTPVAPGGVTVLASTNGRITVAVVVLVGSPDARLGGDTAQHIVRGATDDILKTFDWGSST